MKLIFMPSLLLVLGALARTPSDQQELSAAPDVGFTADNLAQIEASILSLAQATTKSSSFTLGGSNTDYPGYGCLSGANDVAGSTDVDLAGCQTECFNDPSCKSIDFYEGRTGHTCSISYSNFADIGSTTSTDDCRFYEIDRSATTQAAPDNSTLEAIATIYELMNSLIQDVLQRANASQLGVTQSYEKLVGCKLNLTTETSSNLTILNTRHRECSAEESTLAASYVTCTSNCESRCATAQASCGLYCPVNIPQPMPGTPVPSPTPSPTSCWYDTEQVKTDDEVGTYHEWEANLYYKKWEDNFQTLYDDWKTKRDSCHDRVSEMNTCYTSCSTAQAATYQAKKQECTEHQYDLEAAACPDDSPACLGYQACHAFLTNVYVDDITAANASQAIWYVQYQGIMRVVCLLDAFNSSIITGANLSSALDACQARTFEPCTEAPSLCLTLYPVPEAELCNGTFANTSLQPGSDEWITTYYSDMPESTSYEECGAKCCVPGPSTTTTTTSTTLVPSSDCLLCCNTTDDWCSRSSS